MAPHKQGRQASKRLYQGMRAAEAQHASEKDPMTPLILANLVLHQHDGRAPAGAIDAPRAAFVPP